MSDPATTCTVFRGVPADVNTIRPGDYVALDWVYAKSHADALAEWEGMPYKVISLDVPMEHVVWAGPWDGERGDEWCAETGERREFYYQPDNGRSTDV